MCRKKHLRLDHVTKDLILFLCGYAKTSVGMKDGAEASAMAVKWFVKEIRELDEKLAEIEKLMREKYQEIPYAKNILEISGIGENTLSGILAEMGDISRFDDVKEIQSEGMQC